MSIRFAYETIGWHGKLEETLASIATLGFEGVELFDLLDRVEYMEDVAGMLQQADLRLVGAFSCGSFVEKEYLKGEIDDFDATAEAIASLGGEFIITSGGRCVPGKESSDRLGFIKTLGKLGRRSLRAGVQTVVHPHLGTLISTGEDIDALAAGTDANIVKFAFDIAHLTLAGADPIKILQKYLDRVAYVHLKDAKDEEFTELGRGDLPVVKFFRILEDSGYSGWVTIELDGSEDPDATARVNARFVREKLGGTLRRR